MLFDELLKANAGLAEVLKAHPGAAYAAAIDPGMGDFSFSRPCRGLYVGGEGAIKMDVADGALPVRGECTIDLAPGKTTLTTSAVGYLDIRVTKVYARGTTATKLVALW